MPENEKPKITLKELQDMYDIEEIKEEISPKVSKADADYEITIEEEDKKLEEAFEDAS